MSNEEYKQYIVEMLYQMDGEKDGLFLKQIFTILHRHFINQDSDNLKPADRYRGYVLRIVNQLDQVRMKEVYYLLVGYAGNCI